MHLSISTSHPERLAAMRVFSLSAPLRSAGAMRSACVPFRSATLRGCALAVALPPAPQRGLCAPVCLWCPVVSRFAVSAALSACRPSPSPPAGLSRSPPAPPEGGYARLPVRPAGLSVWRFAVLAVHHARPAGRPLTPPAARALRAW